MAKYDYRGWEHVMAWGTGIGYPDLMTHEQVIYSTAEIESSLFYDEQSTSLPEGESPRGPKELYRIVDGELLRVLPSSPPHALPLRKRSGLFTLAG